MTLVFLVVAICLDTMVTRLILLLVCQSFYKSVCLKTLNVHYTCMISSRRRVFVLDFKHIAVSISKPLKDQN